MKHFQIILSVLFCSALLGAEQQYPWSHLTYDEAVQKSQDKTILLDFYTDW